MSYNQVFKCSICKHDYDQQIRQPMMVCRNDHTFCRLCLNDICRVESKNYACPFCKTSIMKKEAVYIGCFFQYRKEAQSLIFQVNKYKQRIKNLKDDLQRQITENDQKSETIEKLSKDNEDYTIQHRKLEKKIDKIDSQNRKMKNQIEQLKYNNEKLTKQCQRFKNSKEKPKKSSQQDLSQIISLKSRLAIYSASQEKQRKKAFQLQKQLNEVKKDVQKFKQVVQKIQQEKKQLKDRLEKAQNSYKEQQSKRISIVKDPKNRDMKQQQCFQMKELKRLCLFHTNNENKLSNKILKLKRQNKYLNSILQEQTDHYSNSQIKMQNSFVENQMFYEQQKSLRKIRQLQDQIYRKQRIYDSERIKNNQLTSNLQKYKIQHYKMTRQFQKFKQQSEKKLKEVSSKFERSKDSQFKTKEQLQKFSQQNAKHKEIVWKYKRPENQQLDRTNESAQSDFWNPIKMQQMSGVPNQQENVCFRGKIQRIFDFFKGILSSKNSTNQINSKNLQNIKQLQAIINKKLAQKITNTQNNWQLILKEGQIKSDLKIEERLNKQKMQRQKFEKKHLEQINKFKKKEQQLLQQIQRENRSFLIKQKSSQQQLQENKKMIQKLQNQNRAYIKQISTIKKPSQDCLQINNMLINSIDNLAEFNESYCKKIIEVRNNLRKFQKREQ